MSLIELSGRPKNKLVQLCLNIEDAKTLKFPMWASEKIDGVYCIAHKNKDGVLTIYSRTGEVYKSMWHLESSLLILMETRTLLIFEACIPGKPQSDASGAARDTKKQHPELKAYVHDLLTEEEFIHPNTGRTYDERYSYLCGVPFYQFDIEFLTVLKVDSTEQANKIADWYFKQGAEGIVLRDPDSKYMGGCRNSSMVKIKQGVSFDLEVVGIERGKGKYIGTTGSLLVRWKDGSTISISGMTDAQRDLWWRTPGAIIGKIVQVDAMALSSKGLLREPRFKGIREDKTEGDY